MSEAKSRAMENKMEKKSAKEVEENPNGVPGKEGSRELKDKSVHHKKHAMDCAGC